MIQRLIAALLLWCGLGAAYGFDVEYVTTVTCAKPARACASIRTAERIVQAVKVQSALQDVPEDLVWKVMQVESRFNPNATSKSGAKGLMQVMPYWHKDKIKNRPIYDIDINIEVGVAILKEYLVKYRTTSRALQAYVGSPKTLQYTKAVYAVKKVKYDTVHPLAVQRHLEQDPVYTRLDNKYQGDPIQYG